MKEYLIKVLGQAVEDEEVAMLAKELEALDSDSHSNTLEKLLVDRLSLWDSSKVPIAKYLLECYARANQETVPQKLSSEMRYLLCSYFGLLLTMPGMFTQPPEAEIRGARLFSDLQNLPAGFLKDMVARWESEPETFQEIFGGLVAGTAEKIAIDGLLGRDLSLDPLVNMVTSCPPIGKILVSCSIPATATGGNTDASRIGQETALGIIFDIGVDRDNPKPLYELLPSLQTTETLLKGQLDSANYTMRTALQMLHGQLHRLLLGIIKTSVAHRGAVLDWFGWVAHLNQDRFKMQVDPLAVSSDRLIWNVFMVLLKFCEPFLSPTSPKLALIDPAYYWRRDCVRIDIQNVTKANATLTAYQEFASKIKASAPEETKSPNFVTECFYLAVQFFQLGPIHIINEYLELLRSLREIQQAVQTFETTQESLTGPMAAVNVAALRNAKAKIQAMTRIKLAMDVCLLDPVAIESIFSLVNLIIAFLFQFGPSNNGSSEGDGRANNSLPPFGMLPEFLIECVADYSLFISRFCPEFWLSRSCDLEWLMRFMVTFLDQADYIHNPYIRSKFVQILFGFTDNPLEHLLDLCPLVCEQLASKLMRFYIEVESTGASSAFYDKFNIRFQISRIIKCLWTGHPLHRARIIETSKDANLFLRFTNLLLNDATYLLDESITKLAEIHERQVEMADPAWKARPYAERQERENGLRLLERQCESYVQLATSTLDMLEFLTDEIVDPFICPEIVDRFAAMLDVNLLHLTGKKCASLKVCQPEKFHFEPRSMLSMLVGTILHMSRKEAFLRAIARDKRSFSRATFEQAAAILKRHNIRPQSDIVRFEHMITRIESLVASEQHQEMELGDIPEEFLDPLMFTLMEEPVILETSKVTVDRSTIVAHLLNDPHDPFNRMPLTMDQITPNQELAERIRQFRSKE